MTDEKKRFRRPWDRAQGHTGGAGEWTRVSLLPVLTPEDVMPCYYAGHVRVGGFFQSRLPVVMCPCRALTSVGCRTVPQAGWLKTTETSSLAVLGARSGKSRCWQGRALPEGSMGILFHASSWLGDAASNALVLLGLRLHLCNVHIPSSRGLLPVCLCARLCVQTASPFSCKDTTHWMQGPPSSSPTSF